VPHYHINSVATCEVSDNISQLLSHPSINMQACKFLHHLQL